MCVVHHGCTVPLLKADLPAGRAAASLGLGWRDRLGLGPLLAGHDSQGGGISGLLNLLAPLAPLMSGLQFRWGFEKREGLGMEGTEEANCSFQGYLQGKITVTMDKDHHICSSLEGTPRDRSASDRNVRSHQMVGRLVCEYVHI